MAILVAGHLCNAEFSVPQWRFFVKIEGRMKSGDAYRESRVMGWGLNFGEGATPHHGTAFQGKYIPNLHLHLQIFSPYQLTLSFDLRKATL